MTVEAEAASDAALAAQAALAAAQAGGAGDRRRSSPRPAAPSTQTQDDVVDHRPRGLHGRRRRLRRRRPPARRRQPHRAAPAGRHPRGARRGAQPPQLEELEDAEAREARADRAARAAVAERDRPPDAADGGRGRRRRRSSPTRRAPSTPSPPRRPRSTRSCARPRSGCCALQGARDAEARLDDAGGGRQAAPTRCPPPAAPSRPTSGRVTSCYGARWGTLHAGVDIAAPIGTPVYTPEGGVVLAGRPGQRLRPRRRRPARRRHDHPLRPREPVSSCPPGRS